MPKFFVTFAKLNELAAMMQACYRALLFIVVFAANFRFELKRSGSENGWLNLDLTINRLLVRAGVERPCLRELMVYAVKDNNFTGWLYAVYIHDEEGDNIDIDISFWLYEYIK